MDEELKGIVQRMIDAGESEANIAKVIQSWNKEKKSLVQNEVSGQDSASGAQTSTEPLRNFQAPDVPEIGVQNLGANLTQPTTFGDITQAADQRIAEQEAAQATVQQQMPYLQEDPTRGAIPTPLSPEGQQEYVQDTLIPHIEQQEQQVQDFNRNLQNIREQNRAAGYFTDQDREEFRKQAIDRIQNDMATQSKNAGFLSRNIIQPASNFAQGFTQGVANIGTGIIGLPEFANDIVASAMNGIIELAGGPEGAVPTWDETYGNTPLDQINSFVSEATQRQRDLLEKKYGEGGTWEQVKKGNINGAINLIANGVGETAPIMALYAMTGGAGAGAQVAGGTALFGSQTYQDLGESDAPTELKLANSLVGGLAEGFFETVGTGWLFNTARKVLRTAGKEQAESFLKDSIEKTLKRAYEKYYVVTAPAGEILTEGATLVTQNFMDQITGVDPERGLLDGWQDTAILAAAASAPISTPTAAIRSIRDKKARKEAEGLLEYNNGIIEALQNEDVNVEEKAALFERYQNNTQKINQYLDQEQEWRGNLTDRQRAMVEEVEQRQSEIETLMQNESLPDAARAGLEQEQSDLDAQMDEIVEETKKLPDSSDFSPETQDRIRDMTARIDEINSEIRRMRNEGTLTPDVEAPLVLERRRIQDEINELEPDAQTEATVETPTDETITETVEETPTEPVEAADTAAEAVVDDNVVKNDNKRTDEILSTKNNFNDVFDTPVTEYGTISLDKAQQAYDEGIAAIDEVNKSNMSRPMKRELIGHINTFLDEIKQNEAKFKTEGTVRESIKTTKIEGVRRTEQEAVPREAAKTPKTVADAINKEVFYKGERGKLRIGEDKAILFESQDGTTVELPVGSKNTRMNLSTIGVEPYVQPVLSEDGTVKRGNSDVGSLLSINKDNDGNVVSYTVKNKEGQERTIRDSEEALDVAIQEQHRKLGGITHVPTERFSEVFTETVSEVVSEPGSIRDSRQTKTELPRANVVAENEAESGQYFTRDIGGEQTVYRRNEDGTASIVPDTEAQDILSQQDVTPAESTAEQTTIEPTVEPVAETTTQQARGTAPETAIEQERTDPEPDRSTETAAREPRPSERMRFNQGPDKPAVEVYMDSHLRASYKSDKALSDATKKIARATYDEQLDLRGLSKDEIVSRADAINLDEVINREEFGGQSAEVTIARGPFGRDKETHTGIITGRNSAGVEITTDTGEKFRSRNFNIFDTPQQEGGTQDGTVRQRETAQAPVSLDPNTVSMPVSQITTDEASFQNREGLDQGRVGDIVENFDEAKLDPIVVYNDNGKTVVLSGHHRLAAAQQMGMESIPARTFNGTRAEAIDFARDSNTLSRQETIPERAKRYAQLRADGVPEAQIQEMARVAHGNQSTQVLNISRLDPQGKAMDAINSFEDSTDADTKNKVMAIGDWIGNAKKRHPDLSRQQENEMFDYLMESYSTKKGAGRITSRSQFADVASSLVDRLKSQGSFGPSSRLNFKNAAGKSSIQLEYDARLADARQAESDARKALDDKRKEVVARGLSVDQQDRVLRPLEENLRVAIRDLSEVRGLKGQVEQVNRQQTSLFDDINDSNTDQYGNTSEQIETILSEETGASQESTDTASEQSEQKAAPPTEAPRQVDEATETTQPETPKKPAAKKPKKAPSFKEVLTSPEARQERSSELLDRIRKYRESQQGQGIAKDSKAEAKYWRDITDYAIIRLVDGAITSVNQLAQELGLKPDKRLRQAFNDARAEIDADPDLATTTGRNLDTAKKRRNYGFDERLPVEREPTADVMAKAKEELQNGYPIEDLFARIEGGAGATSLETAILMQYSAAQEAEVLRQGDEIERTKDSRYAVVNEHIDARERAMNNLLRSYNALEQSGTVNARAMNIRKQLVQWDFSLAGMIAQRRKAIGYDSVSPQQMQEIEQEFRRMQDVIDKIRDRNDLLEQEMTRLEAENAILKVKKEHAETQRSRKRTRTEKVSDVRDRRKEVLGEIGEIWAEITSPGFAYDPKKNADLNRRLTKAIINLAQTYIEEGIINAGEIVDKIHSAVSSVAPGITRQQVTAAIAGTDRESRPQLSDIQRSMRDLRLELRLLEDIERLERGERKIKEPRAKEIRNARIEDLRARLRSLRQSDREQGSKEQNDLSKAKKATQARIKEYQRRIKEKDYAPKVPNLIEEDTELKALRKELKKIRFDFQVESKKFELQRRAKWKKGMDLAIDILNVPRALMATADLSAPLRQGIFVLASRPVMSARAFASMLQFAYKKQTYEDYMLDFIESPGYDLAVKAGLSITDVSSNPSVVAREEQFMSNIASQLLKNVPIIGEKKQVTVKGNKITIPGLDIHGGAERAYNGYLNKLRIDMFERGVEQLQNAGYSTDQNPSAYKALATYINAATGRGPLPESLNLATAALSSVLFSPRLMASRLYLLAGGPLWRAPAPVRKMYIQDAVSFVAFGMAVLALGKLAGADSEDDPRSSDFGKMRFGDDRYDIWGGFTQYITFLSRMFPPTIFGYETGLGVRVTSTGRVRKLDGSEYDKMTRGDLALRFTRSKLSPTAAFVTSYFQNSNYMGEPFDVVDELTNMSYPLVAQDIVEAWESKGAAAALAPGLPIVLGVGFQSYGANDFLQKGVDGAMIDLLNDKKVATMTPMMQDVKVYEPGEGERKITGEEYKRYTKYWSGYIKSDLTNNMAEYKKMGPNTFDKKYQAVKSAATKYAKQQITGVSSDDLRIQSQGKTFKLTPEQVEIRKDLMDQYKERYGHRIYRDRDKYKRQGMSDEMALMQAKKDFASDARSDSRDKMLQMQKRGEIQLTEGLED